MSWHEKTSVAILALAAAGALITAYATVRSMLMQRRKQTEQWTEWTPTWGLRYSTPGVEVSYFGMASAAGHFPWPSLGSTFNPGAITESALSSGDILAPPTGRLEIPNETVVTHRITVSLPIR